MMNRLVLFSIFLFVATDLFCQGNDLTTNLESNISINQVEYEQSPASNFKSKSDYERNCENGFWTIGGRSNGVIQQWQLVNGSISGGDTILMGGASGGLAFCGDSTNLTFYCGNIGDQTIKYLDSSGSWATISAPVTVINNGGYKNDQYYMKYANQVLYHFDGSVFTKVDSLHDNKFFTVADIAVDHLGRAWVFAGVSYDTIHQLRVYDKTGLIKSYSIDFESAGAYGSFFLNGTLYVGFAKSNAIVPIAINGNSATLGKEIPFSYESYHDLASCRSIGAVGLSNIELLKNKVEVFPNPNNGVFNIHIDKQIENGSVVVFNAEGLIVYEKQIGVFNDSYSDRITLEQPAGIYYLRVDDGRNVYREKIVFQGN